MKTNKYLHFVLFLVLLTLLSFSKDKSNPFDDKFVVVLDAGHGGHDPGKPSKAGYKEKDIALKIVLAVGKELEKNENIKVIYTRKKDVFVTLRGRAKIANDADADLFVSIHCNAHHTDAYGTETYVLGVANTDRNFNVAKAENEVIFLEEDYETHYEGFNPNSPESLIGLTLMQEEFVDHSIMLASYVENNFANKLKRKSRGVKQASLWVMHNTYMPSVLIETGFITNKSEGSYLNSSKGQKQISSAIESAILQYKTKLDHNIGKLAIVDNGVGESSATIYKDIIFKVQIAASSRELETKPYNFKGLNTISREKSGSVYKYFHGETSDYNKIKALQADAKLKGFNSCFIVAFKNGKRISLTDALKTPVN